MKQSGNSKYSINLMTPSMWLVMFMRVTSMGMESLGADLTARFLLMTLMATGRWSLLRYPAYTEPKPPLPSKEQVVYFLSNSLLLIIFEDSLFTSLINSSLLLFTGFGLKPKSRLNFILRFLLCKTFKWTLSLYGHSDRCFSTRFSILVLENLLDSGSTKGSLKRYAEFRCFCIQN